MRYNHIVYLDCDGVFADFVTGICEKLGIEFPGFEKWPWSCTWNWCEEAEFTWEQAHAVCDADFWAELPWMLDGIAIYQEVFKRFRARETMLLTKPMDHVESYTGKARWVDTHMPEMSRRLVPTHISKDEFAFDFNCLLIDDSQDNIEAFSRAGGAAILVPRPYNANEKIFYDGDAVEYVADRMDKWIKLTEHPAMNRKESNG